MKALRLHLAPGLLAKTIPIVLIVIQLSIFVSTRKAADHPSLSSHSHGSNAVMSQHSGAGRSVFSPCNAFSWSDTGIAPYNFTPLTLIGSCARITLQPFIKGGTALALTTINAP